MLKEGENRKEGSRGTARETSKSGRILADLVEDLPCMTFRCRADSLWTMTFVNEGSLLITGYPPEDLIDNEEISYVKLIHPADRPFVRNEIESALAENEP
ncbi:PAS domain-containing protein, partial [Candidatus Bipolaricaulota bacterium]|nr:PAS domain-containing protein [Candidatus Bipolaricaulota bacterium]